MFLEDLSDLPAEWHDYARQYGKAEALQRSIMSNIRAANNARDRARPMDIRIADVEARLTGDLSNYCAPDLEALQVRIAEILVQREDADSLARTAAAGTLADLSA